MIKFEYKEESYPGGTTVEFLAWLNDKGADGWEAVHFYRLGAYSIVLFKRILTA
jgi:hypothetical protein